MEEESIEDREGILEQILYKSNRKRTICEVLREMWDISEALDEDLKEEVQERIITAYTMAKKMNRKLRENREGWDEEFWESNINFKKDLRRREKRLDRKHNATRIQKYKYNWTSYSIYI